MDSIALPSGEILPCSRVPLGKGSLSFKARRLEFPSPETARFGPTRVMRMTFVALLLAPVVIVALIIQFADWDLAGKFFGEIFSALAALVGFWGTFTRLETHVLTADHARGTFTARPWVPWPWSQTRRWLLIDIGALQLASRWIANPHDEAKGYVNYEINLVLKTPGGERVHLVTDRHEKRLLWEATQLAAFLKVPLLDHRTLEEPPASATEQSADGTGNPPLLPGSRPDTRTAGH